ncbi:LANO_0H22386g1_1 [Lachancea nothofagi CBS 11611]|uniref:LANO_0H22386g1_1 n=1 Tax=Lachancea nothofagi CBS 11611 TaxID=1266666 RepID=A0A1G4KNM5_9SACH|nr:LANO_0H22386g1_1 [Lachancea nothofagi CBS 11611]
MSKDSSANKEGSNDPRFASVHNDPKFRETKARKYKIKLDDRFSKKDLEFKRKARVDKYGRRLHDEDSKDTKDFEKYYEKEEEQKLEESSSDEDNVVDGKVAEKGLLLDRARGEVPSDYVSSADEGSSSSESEADTEDSDVEGEESEVEIEQSKPESGESSKTLAVVNLDWDHVKSEDLMITFTSFVPKGGKIVRIAVYPSEFGKERLQREELEGPPKEIFKSKKKSKSSKGDDSDSDVDVKDLYEEGDAEDYDVKSLRRYQLERLRYYYAVVYCNNVETAVAIYKNCDGTEFESTANMFDLRYVPDEMDFDDKPRDECSSMPKNYRPALFSTDALQHSKVKLTWDETPADRVAMAKRAFTQKEVDEMDFKAYLASDSEDSEPEDNQDLKNKLRSLANLSAQVGNKSLFDKEAEEGESDVDMQITFAPGLAEGGGDAAEGAEDKIEESTVDKVRRKEKERKKMRKDRIKELKKKAEDDKRQKLKELKTKKHSPVEEGDSKSAAELELLMMDDEEDSSKINNKAHFNMNEIVRSEKEKGKKSKYQDKRKITEDEFKPDLNDPRFNEVFEDHDFAIDPSQPEFKGTTAMKQILQERNKRSYKSKNKKRSVDDLAKDTGSDLKGLVSKIKRSSNIKKMKRQNK